MKKRIITPNYHHLDRATRLLLVYPQRKDFHYYLSHNAQILTTITSFFFVGGRITNIAQFLYDSFIQPFFNHVFKNVIFLYVRCFHFLFSFLIFFFCAQLSVFSGHRKSLLTRIFVSYLYIFHVQVFHTQNLPGEHNTEEHSSINAATGKDRLSIVN